jgi:hypothetical protein
MEELGQLVRMVVLVQQVHLELQVVLEALVQQVQRVVLEAQEPLV